MSVTTSSGLRPLSETVRNNILNDILDSEIKNPKQDGAFRRAETARIAKRRKVHMWQVAGVRSAFAKGSYGSRRSLVNRRKRESA